MVDVISPTDSTLKNIDDILVYLNPYGRFQWIINVLLSIAYGSSLVHNITPYFLSTNLPWRCVANSSLCLSNISRIMTDRERCNLPVTEWEYTKPIEYSIVSQFDLICGREWMSHMATSCLYIGWGVGAVLLGNIADNYGRKIVVIPSAALIYTVGLISAFSPNISMFIICRFIIGILTAGLSPISIILMGEFVDTKHRPLAMFIMYNVYVLIFIILGLQAYFIRKWKLLLVACTIPYTIVLGFYKFIPESVHWLHLHGLNGELENVFKKMARWNKVILVNDITQNLASNNKKISASSVKDLFRTRKLLLMTLNLSFGWFTVVMVYIGLSLAADDLGGSIYLNFVLVSFIEIPANVLMVYASERFGRKPTTCVTVIVGSVACLVITVIPTHGTMKIIRLVFGILGKACITITYNALYIWTFEIYPTDIRGNGVGFLTAVGRSGGASSPWIVKGLRIWNVKVPFIIMGILGLVTGSLFCLLPETKGIAVSDRSSVFEE